MSDVRGATGAPALGAFGGIGTPTPSTPLYVDLSTGDLYVVINETVTLVGSIPGGSSYTLATRAFGIHSYPSAVLGDAADILSARSFAPHPLPTMWS